MTAKKGIQMHGERSISPIYKEYIQLDDIKAMRALILESLKKPQKRGHYKQ